MPAQKKSTAVTPHAINWNSCNVDSRITAPKTRKLARRLVIEMVQATDNQNKVARKMRVNSGIVAWFIVDEDKLHGHDAKETDRLRWTHITLTPLLMERIMIAHAFIVEGVELSDELSAHVDHALDLESELSGELRWIRKAIRRL